MVVIKVAMMLIFLLVLSYSWENSPLSDQLRGRFVRKRDPQPTAE